jgi:NAD(P)-dependent dehydrogenase (short-subunit alcohol dehydrogenase family)
MSDRLKGKVCVVTGAAQGIGAAYATAMAAEGADVAVIDLKRIDQASEVEAEIARLGQRSITLKADVTDAEQMRDAMAKVVSDLGRVDCLVNNAALMYDQLTATWDEFLAVNFMGIVNASNAVVPHLWEQGSGSIVNISSTAAFPLPLPDDMRPGPDSPPPVVDPSGYAITKWMVIFQTRHMAQLLGVRNIRVNAVAPGVTMSPATKAVVPEPIVDALVQGSALRTALEPEDHTGLIVFLASDESSKMTGQVLINDAGTVFVGA